MRTGTIFCYLLALFILSVLNTACVRTKRGGASHAAHQNPAPASRGKPGVSRSQERARQMPLRARGRAQVPASREQRPVPRAQTSGATVESTIPALLRVLLSERNPLRGRAIRLLARFGKEVIPALARYAADPRWWVRDGVARVLARMGPVALWFVEQELAQTDPPRRAFGAYLLTQMGEVARPLHDKIVRLLRRKDLGWGTRRDLLLALRRMGPQDRVLLRSLQRALRDRSPMVRAVAVEGLLDRKRAGYRVLLPYLQKQIKRRRWQDRQQAVLILGRMGRFGLPLLQQAFKDPMIRVRAAALISAGGLRQYARPLISRFVAALLHPKWRVRYPAAEALNAMGRYARPAIPALIAALSDKNWGVRAASSAALGKMGRAALPALSDALHKPLPRTRVVAVRAIRKIRGSQRERAALLARALRDRTKLVRYEAILGLRELHSKAQRRVRSAVIRALGDRDWGVRHEAIGILRKIGISRSVSRRLSRMARRDRHPRVRQQAAQALHQLGVAGAEKLLATLTQRQLPAPVPATSSPDVSKLSRADWCEVSLQSLHWHEKVRRLADRTSLSRMFRRHGYRPPGRSYVLAARIVPGVGGQPAFQYMSMRDTGFAYSPRSYWPASTIKIWAALHALLTLRKFGLDGSAYLSMLDSYGWFQGTAYDLYKHLSNENYDRLMRVAGLQQVNQFADRDRYGVPNIALHRGYGGGGVRLSPRIHFQQAGKTGIIPRRYWSKTHPRCRRNCTTLLDLQEIVRRLVLHHELPAYERFPLFDSDARRWRAAMKKYGKWVRRGVQEALGSDVQIYNKTGSVPGNHMLDNSVIVSRSGRFLLTLATPWPRRYYTASLSVRELNELARQTLLVVRSIPNSSVALQPDFGVSLPTKLFVHTKKAGQVQVVVNARRLESVRVWLGTRPILMTRKAGIFVGHATLPANARAVMVVQGSQDGKIVGYRVLGTKRDVTWKCE